MNRFSFVAHNLNDTERLAAVLAEVLPSGITIGLTGTLGAGKTRFVQAVAANYGVPRSAVVSPTFVLCQEYHAARTIYHLDAYRLHGDADFQQLGPQEYFDSTALVFIEWSDRVRRSLPDERLEIDIAITGDDQRTFEIVAFGERCARVVEALCDRLTNHPTSQKQYGGQCNDE